MYVLREVQHMTTDEAAACLGLSAANIKVSLHRARERLKTILLASAAGMELFQYRAEVRSDDCAGDECDLLMIGELARENIVQ